MPSPPRSESDGTGAGRPLHVHLLAQGFRTGMLRAPRGLPASINSKPSVCACRYEALT